MERQILDAIVTTPFLLDFAKAIHDLTGAPLRFLPGCECACYAQTGWRDCRIHHALARLPATREVCPRQHATARIRADRNGPPCRSCCFAGLKALTVPLIVEGQHIGTLLGGHVFRRTPTDRDFERAMRKLRRLAPTGWDGTLRARLKKAFFAVPVVPPEALRGIEPLARLLAVQLSQSVGHDSLASARNDPPAILRAKEFIHEHLASRILLTDVAAHAHCSSGHFCRLFKRATGCTLIDYVNGQRVERAKALLWRRVLTVKEISAGVGFCCTRAFHRAFRKHAGASPSAYVKEHTE